jgi:hypothetical protein
MLQHRNLPTLWESVVVAEPQRWHAKKYAHVQTAMKHYSKHPYSTAIDLQQERIT